MTPAGSTITILVGAVLLRLTVTGTYRRYVRVGMGPWLAIAGAAVLILGVLALVYVLRRSRPADAHGHDTTEAAHGHHPGTIRVGWLLLAPIAALLLVAPPTLGSYGVGRAASVNVRAGGAVFDPLRHGEAPVPMSLLEYAERAVDRDGASFNGATVELTGFVAGSEADGFRLARYQIACCAADAVPVVVRVAGVTGAAPARDQWVRVTGTYRPRGGKVPVLTATSVVEIATPEEPYE